MGPSPGDLPDPGLEPESLLSPVFAGGFFTTSATWEAHVTTEEPFGCSGCIFSVVKRHNNSSHMDSTVVLSD